MIPSHGASQRPRHVRTDATSSTLLERAQAQDPEAWARLVDLYGPLVYAWCREAGLQSEDAADVVQEVFRGVMTGLPTLERSGSGSGFHAWLRGIAKYKIADHFRRLHRSPHAIGGTDAQQRLLSVPQPPDRPAEAAQGQDKGLLSRRILDLIRTEYEERTWQAFWQVAIEGRSPADVAADLGMSLGAVYQVKSRILRRVRQECSALLADPDPGPSGAI